MILNPLLKNTKGADGVYTIVLMALLGIVTAMLIVIFLPKGCGMCSQKTEGFGSFISQSQGCGATEGFTTDTTTLDSTSFSCPDRTNLYTDMQGNMNCCNGNVDGKICNGKTVCTFSGNALQKYPSCIRPPRKIRWRGTISPWVKEWMNGENYVQKMGAELPFLQRYPTDDMKRVLKQEDIDAWNKFVQEEIAWFQVSQNEPLISYQEEVMLIIDHITALFRKSQVAVPSPIPSVTPPTASSSSSASSSSATSQGYGDIASELKIKMNDDNKQKFMGIFLTTYAGFITNAQKNNMLTYNEYTEHLAFLQRKLEWLKNSQNAPLSDYQVELVRIYNKIGEVNTDSSHTLIGRFMQMYNLM
jgi:hypothetical protein